VALFDLASVAEEKGKQNVPAESSINAIKPNMFHLQWPMAAASAYPDHSILKPAISYQPSFISHTSRSDIEQNAKLN